MPSRFAASTASAPPMTFHLSGGRREERATRMGRNSHLRPDHLAPDFDAAFSDFGIVSALAPIADALRQSGKSINRWICRR